MNYLWIFSAIIIIAFLIYYSSHKEDNNVYNTKKQQIYKDILIRTKRACDKLNIKCFLSSGTCLGYFREGKFIDYDYDVDIGIFYEDWNPDIVNAMTEEGFVLYRVWGSLHNGMELSFYLPGTSIGMHAKIDIFLHYRDKGKKGTVSWYSYSPTKKKIQYRVSDFELRSVKFMGTNVYVPYPTLKYIEEHYGSDWMVPKRPGDYSYHQSPTSIVVSES
jgi:fukutin